MFLLFGLARASTPFPLLFVHHIVYSTVAFSVDILRQFSTFLFCIFLSTTCKRRTIMCKCCTFLLHTNFDIKWALFQCIHIRKNCNTNKCIHKHTHTHTHKNINEQDEETTNHSQKWTYIHTEHASTAVSQRHSIMSNK